MGSGIYRGRFGSGIGYSLHHNLAQDTIDALLSSPHFDQEELKRLPDPRRVAAYFKENLAVVAEAGGAPIGIAGIALDADNGLFGCYIAPEFRHKDLLPELFTRAVEAAWQRVQRSNPSMCPDPVAEQLNYVPPPALRYLEFVIPNAPEARAAAKRIGFDADHPYFESRSRGELTLRMDLRHSGFYSLRRA